jgi:hypothetical protein
MLMIYSRDIPALIRVGISLAYLRDISGISPGYLNFTYELKRGFPGCGQR